MPAKPDPEREWRKSLEAHAHAVVAELHSHAGGVMPAFAPGPLLGGLPTVEIQGPDGEWRRYYVRLTEAARHAPLDPAHLQAMRS